MKSITINGEPSQMTLNGVSTISDLIELIKVTIDPDHMIVGLTLDGEELTEMDWSAPIATFSTRVLDIETDSAENYVESRLTIAVDLVRQIFQDFRESRKLFQHGDTNAGNKLLVSGVNALKSFFSWYSSIIDLIPEEQRAPFSMNTRMTEITDICKGLCEKQLYQSWWALGESLEKQMEPQLDKLEDFCRTLPELYKQRIVN